MENKQEFYPEAKFSIGESVAYVKAGPKKYPKSVGAKKNQKGFEFKVSRIERAWPSTYDLPREVKLFLYFPFGDSGFYEYELESRGKTFDF